MKTDTICAWMTLSLPLCAMGCGLVELLSTPEGKVAGEQVARGVGAVVTNPVNPLAWYELLAGGVTLAGLALGGKKVYDKRKRKHAPPVAA